MFSPVPHFQQTFPASSHSTANPDAIDSATPNHSACNFPPPTVLRVNLRAFSATNTGTKLLHGHAIRDGRQSPYPASAVSLRAESLDNSACAPAECPQIHTLLSRAELPPRWSASSKIAFASSGVRSKMLFIQKPYHTQTKFPNECQVNMITVSNSLQTFSLPWGLIFPWAGCYFFTL